MTSLNSKQVSHLRSLAHHLDAVVQIGKLGVTDAITAQIDQQLQAHELIKIRFGQEAPVDAKTARDSLATATRSAVIQTAGRTLVLYRRRPIKSKLELPGERSKVETKDPRLSLRRKHAKARKKAKAQSQNNEHGSRDNSSLSRLRPRRSNSSRG